MMYECARICAFSKVGLFLPGILLFLAFRADAMKNDVITGKVKSVCISDFFFKTTDKIHVHIKEASAYFTFYMTVIAAYMVETIGAPGYLKPADFSHFR